MIKAILSSDWHIGCNFHNYDLESDHQFYFKQLIALIQKEQPDALFVCGDVFDNANPSAAAQQLFYRTLQQAVDARQGLQVVVIAGNHDNPYRLAAASPFLLWRQINVVGQIEKDHPERHLIPIQKITNPQEQLICLAVPFIRPVELQGAESYGKGVKDLINGLVDASKQIYPTRKMVLLAHMFASGSEIAEDSSERSNIGGQDVVDDLRLDSSVVFAALGHIHKRQRVHGCDSIRYVGSAIPMSFTERNYRHGADVLEVESNGDYTLRSVDFELNRPLRMIPEKPLPWEEVAVLLSKLPGKEEDDKPWLFLQVNVLMDKTDPDMHRHVSEALQQKRVYLCKIVLSHQIYEGSAAIDSQQMDIKQVEPIDMLKQIYIAQKHRDMPEEVIQLAKQVIKEAKEEC